MTSLTNPKLKQRRTKQASDDADVDKEIIVSLMKQGKGRRYVYRQLEKSGIWNEDLSLDAMRLAQKSGLRNEGLRILGLIHTHCPEHYVTMWQESNRLKREDAEMAAEPQEEEFENG